MSETENLQNLKQISSTVSERDLKIWENVAHSTCIQKHTDKLKSEIARMKAAAVEKKQENRILKEQLAELEQTIAIQKQTLRTSERSVVIETTYKNSLLQEAAEFQNSYHKTLEMYEDELKEYREMYQNASPGYKELKTQQTELKKLEVKKMMMDAKVEGLKRSQKQFRDIQERIFYTTMVKFAQFYILYHEREKTQRLVEQRKKEEQALLRQHMRLAEAVKLKKIEFQKRTAAINTSIDNPHPTRASNDTVDKLQKFLNEEILPCSLTPIDCTSRVVTNRDYSKVRVLDDIIVKPLSRPPPVRKPNPEFRKKMEEIMQAAKNEIKRSNSFQFSQKSLSVQSTQKSATPAGTRQNLDAGPQIENSQPQKSQIKANSQPTLQQQSQIRMSSEQQQQQPRLKTNLRPQNQLQPGFTFHESQRSERGIRSSQEKLTPKIPEGIIKNQTENSSILKHLSQNNVDMMDKQGSVSKFFNPMKKTVTFQSEVKTVPQQGVQFQLFAMEEKKREPMTAVTDMNIFHRPFNYEDETTKKESFMETESTAETGNTTNNVSFSEATGPTTFSTYGDASEKRNEAVFDLDTSFSRNFGQPPLNQATDENPSTSFNFLRSQTKNNLFGFF